MESMKQTIEELEKKNVHLEAMVSALEQHIQDIEQKHLSKCIEISNVPAVEHENLFKIAANVAKKLKQPADSITNINRLDGISDLPGVIRIELKEEKMKQKWLKSAQKNHITVADVIPNAKNITKPVLIKEALSTFKKNIIWQTRQELKDKLNDTFSNRGFTSVCNEKRYSILWFSNKVLMNYS